MMHGLKWIAAVVVAVGLTSMAAGQAVTYTFSASDGAAWPSEIEGWGEYETPDYLIIQNYTSDPLYVGTGYSQISHGSLFNSGSDALWGQSLFGGSLYFQLPDNMQSVSFDFAWATGNWSSPPGSLDVDLYDGDGFVFGTETINFANLFNFDDVYGYEAQVAFNAGALNVPNGISAFEIMLNSFDAEYGIDNLRFSSTPAGEPNTGSQVRLTYMVQGVGLVEHAQGGEIGAHIIKGASGGEYIFEDNVTNFGTDATTYSLGYTGDLARPSGMLVENLPIDAGQTLPSGAYAAAADTTQLSGHYVGSITLTNDLNAGDTPHTLTYHYTVQDAAIISVNNAQAISASGDNEITIANAEVEAHDGAIRASMKVVGQSLFGSGFFVAGININDLIHAGEEISGTVGFNPVGKVAGTYNGAYSVDLQMVSGGSVFGEPLGGGLNGAFGTETFNWFLTETVTAQTQYQQVIASGTNFGQAAIGIQNENTAMTLIDGIASSEQSVVAEFVNDPSLPLSGILGSAINLQLGDIEDFYVLQLTYLDADLPNNFDELALRLNVFDPIAEAWVHAIDLNSTPGGEFFAGSYHDYLDFIGTVPALGAHGVDALNNHVWAVLDHNSIYAIALPEPTSLALLGLGMVLGMRRRR